MPAAKPDNVLQKAAVGEIPLSKSFVSALVEHRVAETMQVYQEVPWLHSASTSAVWLSCARGSGGGMRLTSTVSIIMAASKQHTVENTHGLTSQHAELVPWYLSQLRMEFACCGAGPCRTSPSSIWVTVDSVGMDQCRISCSLPSRPDFCPVPRSEP